MNNTIIPRDAASTVVERLAIHSLVFLLPFLALISNFGVGFCSFAFLLAAIVYWRAGRVAAAPSYRDPRRIDSLRPQFRPGAGADAVAPRFAAHAGKAVPRNGRRDGAADGAGLPSQSQGAVVRPDRRRAGRRRLHRLPALGDRRGPAGRLDQLHHLRRHRAVHGPDVAAGVLDFKGRQVVWPSLGALAGVVGSIATGTRGGWIAILFAIALFLQYGHFVRGKSIKAMALLVLVLLAGSWYIPQTGARARIYEGVNDVETYVNGGSVFTHMGIRFELWKGATMLIARHPWGGATLPEVRAELAGLVAERQLDPVVTIMPHFHNDVLQELVFGGIPGLLVWASTLL